MRRIFWILTFCLCFGPILAKKVETHSAVAAGGYKFWISTPDDVSTPKPVVIFLHGASLCGNDLNKVKRYGTIDAVDRGRDIDAYIVAPQNPGGAWKPAKIKEILDWAVRSQNVDTTRVYVLGMSLGGYGTIDFAATYPDEVAAAIAMCGGGTASTIADLNKVPLWIVHGTADTAVPISQSDKVVETMKKEEGGGERLIYNRIPGMNHSRPARMFYMPEVYEWLFQHSLSEEGRPVHEAFDLTDSMFSTAYKNLNMSGKSSSSSSKKKTSTKKRARRKKSTRKR